MLADYQTAFIDFAISNDVLKFGEFTLKSGRISPYFFNAGAFASGNALATLGTFYAQALIASGLEYDVLFGPAYKGIPLVAATVIALATDHDISVPYVFNRKEQKNHGEGGLLVGAPLQGKAVIIDDVITAGTAIREVINIIQPTEATISGVLVAIDRQEKGERQFSAIQEVQREYGISVVSIVTLEHIVQYLQVNESYAEALIQVEEYRKKYGVGF